MGGPRTVRASHQVRKPLQVARAGAVAASAASPCRVHCLRPFGHRAGCTPPTERALAAQEHPRMMLLLSVPGGILALLRHTPG